MRSSRPILLATFGIAAATAVAIFWVRSRSKALSSGAAEPDDLYVAALDGVVGQPSRLLPANLPRPRLRFPRPRRDA